MSFWSTLVVLVAAALAALWWLAVVWQRRSLARLVEVVQAQARSRPAESGDRLSLAVLPAPVARYLNHVLPPHKRHLRLARYEQVGSLRTDPGSERWMDFSASHTIAPAAIAFVWDARVTVLPWVHVRVRDALVHGIGSGQVALLSAIPVGSASGGLPMNSGSLHRFLAEAVWCPTALLPSATLRWEPVDETRALVTLTQGSVAVSLAFRFNAANEVVGIYTPGRWGSFGGGYQQLPWEGRFQDYAEHDGVLVPMRGEVGWYLGGEWRAVWKGHITRASLE